MTGTPGAEVILLVSLSSTWSVAPWLSGAFTFGPEVRRVALGTIPANGGLVTSLTIPQLVGLSVSLMLHVQIANRHPAIPAELGTGQVLCRMNPAY